jgi:hypothetical protein
MGVIKRFAVGSIVLGSLAMLGGASALAFESGAEQAPAEQPVQPVQEPTTSDVPAETPSAVPSATPSDVPSDVLPETGGSISDSDAWRWIAPQGR